MRLAVLAFFAVLLPLGAQGRWNVAHFVDADETELYLRTIEFPSNERGIAVGILTENKRPRPVALVTANGGKTWDQVRLKEDPLALACFTDAVCWLSTPRGVWRTDEGGRVWTKISNTKPILRMQFVSATRGVAAGAEKMAWETSDGGKTWTPLAVLAEVKSTAANTSFQAVGMSGNFGLISGNSRPPRRDRSIYPDWMIPEDVSKRRELPGMMIVLETKDAGKTWSQSVTSMFGTVSNLRMRPDGSGAAVLLEYFHSFEIPAEVLMVEFRGGKSSVVFRDKTVAATDVLVGDNGYMLVAGVESTGLRALPIPQRAVFREATVAEGSASVLWTKQDVDYRVTARRVALARKPNGQMWAVTDTGFILRLDRDVKPVQ